MLPRWPTHGWAAPFWSKLDFERQLQPCSISETCENFAPTYQCWLHSGHHQLGRFILEFVLMVRRLVFTCVVNDRRPSFQRTQLQHQLAGFVNCIQVVKVKVSEVGCQEKAPMHQPRFSSRTRQVQGRCEQLLRANGLAGGPTHPGFRTTTGQKKPWSSDPPNDATR